jgi:murein L,D-transpeptidase YafK
MVRFSRLVRVGLAVAAGLAVLAVGACSDYEGALPKHMRPLDEKTRKLVERKGMELRSPILVRIFKEEATLEVWKQQRSSGRYVFLKDYEICAWSGVLGPKIREGDRQAPEGFYTIRPAQMNPDSSYYLAFNMGYPNEFDRSLGRTGSELMVHGACSSRGCYSMTDESIQEIYTLGRLAFQGGQRDFQVQAFPFRMTAENIARHRNDPNLPFWLMLKEGYDSFDLLGQPPKIDVCDQRYIFNSTPADGMTFSASAQCPPMSMPETIRTALGAKQARDNERMLEIAARLDEREGQSGAAAIRLALAEPSSVERSMPLMMSVATAPVSLEPSTTTVEPAMTASVSAQASGMDTVTSQTMSPPGAAIAATPAQVPAPLPSVAVAAAPIPQAEPDPIAAAIDAGFLAVPDLRSGEVEVPPQPAAAPAQPGPDSDVATLEERMLAGSTPADASVANSYASASEEEDGLTGMVLKLIKKQQQDGVAPN